VCGEETGERIAFGTLDRTDDRGEQPLAGTEVVDEHPVTRADALGKGAQTRLSHPVLGEPADRLAQQLFSGGGSGHSEGLDASDIDSFLRRNRTALILTAGRRLPPISPNGDLDR
jgi:hypothetical protein